MADSAQDGFASLFGERRGRPVEAHGAGERPPAQAEPATPVEAEGAQAQRAAALHADATALARGVSPQTLARWRQHGLLRARPPAALSPRKRKRQRAL